MKRYSQNAEQDHIINYFGGEIGKFVDIGAYDVFRFSNTRALYEQGWSGVLVEPAPANYKAIADHYEGEKRIKVINAAVGDPAGMIDFYESCGDAVSTTDKAHMEKWGAAGVKYEKIRVPQIGVEDFFDRFGRGIDFLSIDTESTNLQLFRNIPEWVWAEVKMLCIEHDGGYEEVMGRLRPVGFKELYLNAENIIVTR